MYLVYFLNIDLNNDILSSYWKRGKYKIFILSLIQTEAIKQMVAGESCCGEWVVSDEESIKFLYFLSYPNRGNKTNGGWGELLW